MNIQLIFHILQKQTAVVLQTFTLYSNMGIVCYISSQDIIRILSAKERISQLGKYTLSEKSETSVQLVKIDDIQ